MKTFLARQPILDIEGSTVGYELLFRTNNQNKATIVDDYSASLKVIKDLLVNFGIKEIASDKRTFIKFTDKLILDGGIDFLLPEKMVIELHGIDTNNEEFVTRLNDYKLKGFLLLGDKINHESVNREFISMMDMLKVDFSSNSRKEIETITGILASYSKVLVAEKVEDYDTYVYAKSLGFTLFQGYYFQKPVLMESSEISSIPTVYFQMLNELNKSEVNYDKLANTIKQDTTMTLAILKLMNSAAYYSKKKITSIKDALIRLGEKESRRILMINMLKTLADEGSVDELVRVSLQRGAQAERLAKHFGIGNRKDELFLVGLLSLINVIARRPMPKILQGVPLQADVIATLLGDQNSLSHVLDTIVLYEAEEYEKVEKVLKEHNIDICKLSEICSEAVKWSNEVFG